MKLALALALFSAPALAAPAAGNKLLDCNLNFGPIAQVVVRDDGSALSYQALTETGRWLDAQPLEAADWARHNISFVYRDERIELSSKNGRSWDYRVYDVDGTNPTVIGAADCE